LSATLYLHLGKGRCGSTAIQRFASENRAALAAKGVSYPSEQELGVPDHGRRANARTLYELYPGGSSHELLGGFLAANEQPKILLSSEWLLHGSLRFLSAVTETARAHGVEVVALAYVREQREWLISRYAQGVKSKRWTMSLEDYVAAEYRSPKLNYRRVFSRLAALCGRDNLVIRVFERPKLAGGDVRVDAFDVLGVDVRELTADEPGANASVSVEEVEVMRFLNGRDGSAFKPRDFLRHAEEVWRETGWQPDRELFRLVSPALLRQLDDYFSRRNEVFRRHFFPDTPSPLFASRIPADYEPLDPDAWINRRSFELLSHHMLRILHG
jgi:hypothetical protein